MQKETTEQLMKERSYSASLSAGFRLYMTHFKQIFKSTWIVALLVSLLTGVTATVHFIYWPELFANVFSDVAHAFRYVDRFWQLTATISLTALLTMVAQCVFAAYGLAVLSEHKEQGIISNVRRHLHWEGYMVWRTVKASLFTVLIGCVLVCPVAAFVYWRRGMLTAPGSNIVSIVATVVLLIIVGVAMLPLVYINMKYLLTRKTSFFPTVVSSYGTSLRYWGYQFVIVLVCVILLGVLVSVSSLPEYILQRANWEAHLGVVGGDPLGMPDYIVPLTFIACAICTFMQLYILLSALFPTCYMYGAIDTREQTKKNKL